MRIHIPHREGSIQIAAGQELLGACVASYQSFGEYARFHPHWHVLVLEGGFTGHDRFVYLPIGAERGFSACPPLRSVLR
jgi:hypothetical protein